MLSEIRCERDVYEVLQQYITFAPSCLALGWEWEVEESYRPRGRSYELRGYLIRTSFRRPDTESAEVQTGYGRWWFVERGAHPSSVVKTAWLALKQVSEHELMEAFLVRGSRAFDPHADVFDLVDLHRRRGR